VSIVWAGFGLSAETWATAVLVMALIIALAMILIRRDIAYSLVIVWALAVIAINQNASPNIVLTAEVALVVIVAALVASRVIYRLRKPISPEPLIKRKIQVH
jgi:translocator protein